MGEKSSRSRERPWDTAKVGLLRDVAALGACRLLIFLPAPAEGVMDLWGTTEIQVFLIFQVGKTGNQKTNGRTNSEYYFLTDLVY